MATKTQYGRISHISMTSAQWGTSSDVLNVGEIGYDSTNKRVKVGDGTSTWSSLPYDAEISDDTGITCDDFSI